MSESAAELERKLKEMKSSAQAEIQDNQNSFQELKSIKLSLTQKQITYDNLVKLHYTTLKLLKIKRSKSLNQFEDSIQKFKTLDNQIAEVGLNHCFKMIQLKIRYELDVYDSIETCQLEILDLIREEIKTKECLKEAKLLQRGNRKVLDIVEEVEIMLRKKMDYDLQRVERIERLEMCNFEKLELEKKKTEKLKLEIEELRRVLKMDRIRNATDIVGSVLRFVILVLVLIMWFRN